VYGNGLTPVQGCWLPAAAWHSHLVEISLQGRLHQQLGAEAGDFFKDLRQLPILGKQGVDLGADTVGG